METGTLGYSGQDRAPGTPEEGRSSPPRALASGNQPKPGSTAHVAQSRAPAHSVWGMWVPLTSPGAHGSRVRAGTGDRSPKAGQVSRSLGGRDPSPGARTGVKCLGAQRVLRQQGAAGTYLRQRPHLQARRTRPSAPGKGGRRPCDRTPPRPARAPCPEPHCWPHARHGGGAGAGRGGRREGGRREGGREGASAPPPPPTPPRSLPPLPPPRASRVAPPPRLPRPRAAPRRRAPAAPAPPLDAGGRRPSSQRRRAAARAAAARAAGGPEAGARA